MTTQASALHRALAVLAPPKRFQLLLLLLSGPDRSVSQLSRLVRLSQSCTTRHLQSLERAGLAKRERDGKRVVFRPAPRDATTRAVIGSLSSLVGLADSSRLDPVLAAGIALGALPVASTAELEPPPAEREPSRSSAAVRVRRARPRVDMPPPVVDGGREEPESAIKSDSRPTPYWQRSEIEDFLL